MAEKLLVVDDDDTFREEFKESLEEYEVVDVPNGDEALKLLRRPNAIDLVTLDVKMPGLNGLKVLKEIKRLSPDVGIVIITGYGSKDVTLEALRGHADDFIEKPVDIDKIKEIIERVIESKKGSDQNAPEIENKIDKVKRFTERNINKSVRLKDAAQAVCLSPKYLSRVFQQITGMGFSEYRLKLTVEKAKIQLQNTTFNINQIAYGLGYQNAESFIRVFKNNTGYTPTAYRIKCKSKPSRSVKKK
jgi:YesN/AraC family two-component response regulator